MKTLDEVIKAYEYCIDNNYRDCRGCPYGCEDGESDCANAEEKTDALHYLKEYQKIEDEYEELKDWWAEEHAENVPLTWDELKGMEGKPVWIELLNHDMWDDPSHRVDSEWWVIGEVRKDDIILATYLDEMELCEEDINVLWQAYRKERK